MAQELKNKLAYQTVFSAVQVLLPLISYPYITRVLGPANLGKINYVDFLVQLFVIFASFGVPFYGVREVARVRDDKEKRSILVQELSVLLFLLSIISSVVFIITVYSGWADNSFIYVLGICNILFNTFSYEWYAHGMEAFRFIAIRSFIIRLCMLIAFFVFVKTSNDYPVYYLIFTIGFLLISVTNISKAVKENKFINQPLNYRRHLKPLWHFFLTSSAISIYIYFDTIILKQITQSNEAVGYYTMPLKIVKVCQMVLLSAGLVLLPRLSYLAGADNVDAVKKYLSKFFNLIITAGLPVCAGMLLLAPEIISVIAGESFLPATPVLRILSFLPFIIGLSNLFAFQVLVPFQKENKFLTAVVIGCIISVSLNLLLIPRLSEQGAAITNITTEIFITIITGVYAVKVVQFSISIQSVIQTIACVVLFIPVTFLAKYLFAAPLTVLCFCIAACGLMYFCLQYFVFKNQIIKEAFQYLSSIFNNKS